MTGDRGLRIRAALGALLLLFLFGGLAHSAAPNRIRRRIGVGAFSPLQLPGLQLWLDATFITGMANGGSVASWPDRGPLNNPALQATGAKQPTYVTNAQNGKPAVAFNGANPGQTMDFTAISLTNFTFVVVSFVTGFNNANYMIGGNGEGVQAGGTLTVGYGVFGGANFRESNSKPIPWGITTFQNAHLYRDGVEPSYNTNQTPPSCLVTRIGGRTDQTNLNHNGQIGEVLIYNRQLSLGELALLWGYLKPKWGTP